MMSHGKNSLLPPKIPFPSVSPSFSDYIPSSAAVGSRALSKIRDGNSHQRTSSESFLIEEQPSWLDELLDEPETPVRKGAHRRSSSDSFAYIDTPGNYVAPDNRKSNSITPMSSWGSQEFDMYKVLRPSSYHTDTPVNSVPPPWGLTSPRDTANVLNSGLMSTSHGADRIPASLAETQDPKGSFENKDHTHAKCLASEADTKRAKQKFAQRSRVRKLQYIAALERNVQSLEAEGSGVSAEFDFLNQQNMILSMENKALKHRLESLSQEQLIKHLEHEVLEREVVRLRNLYQQQQLQRVQQVATSGHQRAKSRHLDQQFADLSLKHKEASPEC
ncbi:uncharacterized protein At4g06598-like [Andrographis paniculata]|uniref:uncharacterized protein At4g06598-like n=1 Tax=Andrographis paniculata TaxID=175694 RepID=UPI0021E762C4|nr:uncharacterized protein At4g06598-like [Andrographis paniculata]